jgi:histidinol-phosphate aminotransferase
MKRLVKESIERIGSYQPGKPLEELEREYGIKGAVKLASNENPLGPSPKAVEAIVAALNGIHRYPDTNGFYLKEKLSRKLGVGSDNLILGNGSDEIIQLIAHAFLLPGEEAIMGDPTFSFYQMVVTAAEGKEVMVPLKNFSYDLSAMVDRITSRTKLIFLNNPLNPTGTIVTKEDMESFLKLIPSDVILVLDEAYLEYVADPCFPNSLDYLESGKKIFILRTFSKAYGLAGLRIGYGIADTQLIDCLNKIKGPFNTSSLAQAAALNALDDEGHLKKTLANNQEGLSYLYGELNALGIECLPTQANFFLIKIGENALSVYEALMQEGVIVRTMAGYGLHHYLRITVGLASENEKLVKALTQIMSRGK